MWCYLHGRSISLIYILCMPFVLITLDDPVFTEDIYLFIRYDLPIYTIYTILGIYRNVAVHASDGGNVPQVQASGSSGRIVPLHAHTYLLRLVPDIGVVSIVDGFSSNIPANQHQITRPNLNCYFHVIFINTVFEMQKEAVKINTY